MSENKPPFKILTGGFTYGHTSVAGDFWVFANGIWEVKSLPPQSGAYFALTIAGRTVRPLIRLSDVQSYQEWQALNDIKPSPDEWWARHDD